MQGEGEIQFSESFIIKFNSGLIPWLYTLQGEGPVRGWPFFHLPSLSKRVSFSFGLTFIGQAVHIY